MKSKKKYAEVALPVPIDHTFTYIVPEPMQDAVLIGVRVLVPFGVRKLTGFVVGFSAIVSIKDVKPIEDILDETPIISTELFRLARWISEYYICPLGEVLKAMVPSGMNLESKIMITLASNCQYYSSLLNKITSAGQRKILQLLLQENKITLQQLRKKQDLLNLSFALSQLERSGLIKKELIIPAPKAKPKVEKWVRISRGFLQADDINQFENRTPKQATCLKLLLKKKEMSRKDLLKSTGVSISCINTLSRKKFIEIFEKEVSRNYYSPFKFRTAINIELNNDQKRAVTEIEKAIDNAFFKTFLLFGVTGSGKTQVYIEAIKRTLAKGRTAIVLVPEISLTPQTVSRFTANFPGLVAVLHSRMSIGERYDSWRRIRQGKFKIVIGARSAVFAPLENIGLIVVDEEQESSYKQYDKQPLYHARDVAIVRGKLNEAVIILGSATPSLESFYNTKIKKYQLLELPRRVDNIPLPEVRIVDVRNQHKTHPNRKVGIVSGNLHNKIIEKLKLGEQIILLQNRRGFSTFIKCRDCGFIEKCINCDITLTYHITVHRLRCHYCNYIKHAPDVCPKCNSSDILFQGIGTQRVETEIKKRFPQARIVRMDIDTTAQKKSHDRILKNFELQRYNILLGTQMVAKGLDFERVTLVGVISADTALLLPDFRASERTFQLLTQVAGRAGRKNKRGEVLIQTYSPDNYGLLCATCHDFLKFFSLEIQNRKELNYPPFSRIIQILIKGEKEQQVITMINEFKEALPVDDEMYQILGPVATPISKIQNYYRWHLILKINKESDPSGKLVNKLIRDIENRIEKSIKKNKLKLYVNVDPVSLL